MTIMDDDQRKSKSKKTEPNHTKALGFLFFFDNKHSWPLLFFYFYAFAVGPLFKVKKEAATPAVQ